MSNQKDHPGRIIVKNYPSDTSTRDLQIMFEKYGKIDDLFTPKNRENDKPRGFSFIRYRRVEDAEDAIRGMSGRDIDGHKIVVEFAYRDGGGGGGRNGSTSRGSGRGSFRGSRDETRPRSRRSPSPRRYRSRSTSPRDRLRGERDAFPRYPERDEYMGGGGGHYHDPYPSGPPPSHQPGPAYSRPPPHEGMMDHTHPPPHHYEMDPYPPPRHGPMGGDMAPPNVHTSTRHPMPGRKTLLNTPNLPPPHHQARPPGGHPPHYADGPGPQPHPPHHPEQQYRSQPVDHFGNPPPKHHGGRDPYYPSRDSYGAGEGPRGSNSSIGYPPPRGPSQDGYNPPSRGYYDDPPQNQTYQDPPPPRNNYPPPGEGGRDGYGRAFDSGHRQPPDEYYSSNNDYGPPPSGSGGFRTSGSDYHTSSHNPGQQSSSEYGGGYGSDRAGPGGYNQAPPTGGYKDDMDYNYPNEPRQVNKYSGGQPPGQHTPNPPRPPPVGYEGSGGYTSRNEPMGPSVRKVTYEHSDNTSARYPYGSSQQQESPQRQGRPRLSGGYHDPPPPQSYPTKNPSAGYPNLPLTQGGPEGVSRGGQQRGGGSGTGQSGYSSSYSMSSYSTGYGDPTSSGSQQREVRSSGSTGSGKGLVTGSSTSRGPRPPATTNTGFVPSQSYTKPGPPF